MLPIPIDTRRALGLADNAESASNAANCQSRSLLLERYANPQLEKEARKNFFQAVVRKAAIADQVRSWLPFLQKEMCLTFDGILFAQLQSRLMVNMSGGVMENAALCLNRYGMPYIPGSAVKGCARRMALAALHEWCEVGNKPNGADNPCAKCCEPFAKPAEMLAAIASLFGWCETDWKKESDFSWACDGQWSLILTETASLLPAMVKDFAGSVSFLPAHPVDLGQTGKLDGFTSDIPQPGKLELDVVTCHHPKYYQQKTVNGKPTMPAFDNEDPNPVIFPAVTAGAVFVFACLPLRCVKVPQNNSNTTLVGLAIQWLAAGLATFGLGAKTNAGYGWFDSGDKVQQSVRQALDKAERNRVEDQERQKEAQRRIDEEKDRQRKIEHLKSITANMTPEQKEDHKLTALSEEQFRGYLEGISKRDSAEQQAIVRALRLLPDQTGSRRNHWDELKKKSAKGGKWAQIEQLVRQISKQLFPGKEGKMP